MYGFNVGDKVRIKAAHISWINNGIGTVCGFSITPDDAIKVNNITFDDDSPRELKSESKYYGSVDMFTKIPVYEFEIMIPFDGFYESMHSYEIDREIESMYADRETGEIETETQQEKVMNFPHDKQLNMDYCKLFVESFNALFESDTPLFTFKELISPREYNFSTDRILCTMNTAVLSLMLKTVSRDCLLKAFHANFQSYSGFHSYYDIDIENHDTPVNWDCNEMQVLLFAYLETLELDWDDTNIMEDCNCNGEISDIVYTCAARNNYSTGE